MSVEQRLINLENAIGNTVAPNDLPTTATIPTTGGLIGVNPSSNEFERVNTSLFAITSQLTITFTTSLVQAASGLKIFCNAGAAINVNVDHLALATNHENYFVNESAFNVTFVASVANSTVIVSPNALILQPNGAAYLIRKGALNKTFLYISNP
tara:strand:+ start:166 stop:627 length:462 start_codon:yes stop_codon:yes gene_type:complete